MSKISFYNLKVFVCLFKMGEMTFWQGKGNGKLGTRGWAQFDPTSLGRGLTDGRAQEEEN